VAERAAKPPPPVQIGAAPPKLPRSLPVTWVNIIPFAIPPLRERRDEIPGLVRHFTDDAAVEFKKGHLRIAEETMEHLLLYEWPGNIRQLQNEIRRMVALAEVDSMLMPSALSARVLRGKSMQTVNAGPAPEMSIGLHEKLTPTLWKIEREMIRVALTSHKGKVDEAAKSLGISRKGLYLKRRRLGI
jgi:DNA-binding NtrC family response regulator